MNPVFLLHTYKDQPLAERLIDQIYRHYPNERVICISDGDEISTGLQQLEAAGLDLVMGSRLKLMEHGGAFVRRYLSYFLKNTNGDLLVKLDPDTMIHRKFAFVSALDEAWDWFGTVPPDGKQRHFTSPYCRGGCWVMRREAVQRIVDSRLLENPKYKQIPYGYQRYVKFRWPWEDQSNEFISHEDFILGDVASQLGLVLGNWDEVYIQFRSEIPENLNNRWAATHPHPYPG